MSPHDLFCFCAALFFEASTHQTVFYPSNSKELITFFSPLSDFLPKTVNLRVVQPLILLCLAEGLRDHMSRSVPEKPPKVGVKTADAHSAATQSHRLEVFATRPPFAPSQLVFFLF